MTLLRRMQRQARRRRRCRRLRVECQRGEGGRGGQRGAEMKLGMSEEATAASNGVAAAATVAAPVAAALLGNLRMNERGRSGFIRPANGKKVGRKILQYRRP